MKKILFNLLVIGLFGTITASNNNSTNTNGNTLRLVHVFFRHGSRTPEVEDSYPTDPYKWETFSSLGWGQLTNEGKQSAFELGKVLRKRYNSFLGEMYSSEIVLASSTDFDRTKMTALLVLAGLFPPAPSQTWNDKIPWIPIPYHFDKSKYDYTLRRPTKYCPAYVKALDEVFSSPKMQRELKNYRKIMQYIAKNTRKPMNKLLDVFSIYQTLTAEETMNLTLPEWTKSVYPQEINEIAGKQCYYENSNSVLKRLNGGRMLGKIIENMVNKTKGELVPNERKIFLYSGHENNVINILAALNLYIPHVPKYTSAVIVELHYIAEIDGNYAVKVYYGRNVNTELEELKLDGCDVLCPLNNFIQITAPHVPVNYTAECNSPINLD